MNIEGGASLFLDDPDFYPRAFRIAAEGQAAGDGALERICKEEFETLSEELELTFLQPAAAARNTLRTRALAMRLIDEKGRLDRPALRRAIELFRENCYSLGPGRQHDIEKQEHILRVLQLLERDKKFEGALAAISRPHMHPAADRIIRDALQLPSKTSITNAHARQAALSAWLCTLRQSLGSCFATAPAILVQEELPDRFLADLRELLGTGRIKRTFQGTEYAVPLSSSWGHGGLKRPIFLSGQVEEAAKRLSLSPGFSAALTAAGLLSEKAERKEKRAALQRILYNALSKIRAQGAEHFDVEEILREILLENSGLTEKDLQEYQSRPNEMIHGGFMVRMPKSGGGKGLLCKQFLSDLESAKSAFKGIADNALLRCWEYTIASFAEAGADIAKWNFYASLGMRHEDAGGIGERLYLLLLDKMERQRKKAEEYEKDYELVFNQVKVLEMRVRRAATEQELRWVRGDYQARVNELHSIQQLRDRAVIVAKRFSHLFNDLIDSYLEYFPRYFQEVYDAEMMEVKPDIFDDSPAGFRLVYKHGRENSSQWTKIESYQEFVQCLANFFTSVERELQTHQKLKGLEKEIGEITTELVHHVRTKEFIESAFRRMAAAHGGKIVANPLENLEKVEKKPWVYSSGGNLNALIKNYFCRESELFKDSKWVESPTELFAFIIDTLRKASEKNGGRPLLMHSPVHVFLLKKEFPRFAALWKSAVYSYTVIKEEFVQPAEKSLALCYLSEEMIGRLVERLAQKVPAGHRHYFTKIFGVMRTSMAPAAFRGYLVDRMEADIGMQHRGVPVLQPEEIDSELFSSLPLFPAYQLKERVEKVLGALPGIEKDLLSRALKLFDLYQPRSWRKQVFTALELQEICKALLCLAAEKCAFAENYHRHIRAACEKEGYCFPLAVKFADTNWEGAYFAFAVNPGTEKVGLWRVDSLCNEGEAMAAWEEWLDGSHRDPKWGIAYNLAEYS